MKKPKQQLGVSYLRRGIGLFVIFILFTNSFPSGGDTVVRHGPLSLQQTQQQQAARQKQGLLRSGESVQPKPVGWKIMGFFDTRLHFNCEPYSWNQNKPLPSLKDWQFFQNTYKRIVDKNVVFDDTVPPTMGYTLNEAGITPFYADYSADGRGRGLFASRDIKKGELVHDGDRENLIFPGAMAWREYVFNLPRKKACDVIDWTWTQKTEENSGYRIYLAMDISVLLNDGYDNIIGINVNPISSASSKYYALCDIKKGEELLTDYEVFETVWDKVGL